MFWMYIVRCNDASFYIGHTDNLEQRLAQHHQGAFRECYTFWRRPIVLLFSQPFPTREEAFAMERRVKGWSRAKKAALCEGNWAEIARLARGKHPSTGSGRTDGQSADPQVRERKRGE